MLTKTTSSLVPRRKRPTESLFERTAEWRKMKTAMDAGLKPESKPGRDDAEALMVSLTDDEKATIGISNRKTIYRFVLKYVTEKGFNYRVRSFRHSDKDYIIVDGERAKR